MRIVGLITEYNPFHNGHHYHIKKAKKITNADYCIVVMSGNYVQRGEPAIVDKWTRASSALHCGADLVLEIPTYFATSSAEYFAAASVQLLEATGIVDALCFGSEIGSIEPLNTVASFLADETPEYKNYLLNFLDQGLSFPSARAHTLKKLLGSDSHKVIDAPNNILGIEYLKALKRIQSPIEPFTIKRCGASYHDLSTETIYASASAIRQLLLTQKNTKKLEALVPKSSSILLNKSISNCTAPIFFDDFFALLKYRILMSDPNELKAIVDISEGLENRIITCMQNATSLEELVSLIATKRFTLTRIRRALLHILLNVQKKTFKTYCDHGYCQYLKVLGFRKDARNVMKALKNDASLPIIVNVKDSEKKLNGIAIDMLQHEIMYTNIYNTIIHDKFGKSVKNDYTQPILVI